MEFTDVELTGGAEIATTDLVEKARWVHAL
jgi:hypothetical protein